MGPNTVIHQPLANSTIRLLDVHPGKGAEPLTLSLSPVPLDSHPAYEVISYHWGPPTDVVPVTCNGVKVLVTASLFGALSQFRLADRRRPLWADAICINQTDRREKSIQVGLMPQIYSQATRVLIWLGPLDEARVLLRLPEWIQQTRGLLPPPPPTLDAPEVVLQYKELTADGKSNLYDYDWVPLAALVARPWFRRKWIVQEVVLAREAVLCVGHVRLPWTELALLTYTMSTFELMAIANPSVGRNYKPEDGKGPWTLTQSFALPMQNIFFILEVSRNRQHATDYEISVAESFIRFTKGLLLEDQSLKVFGLAPYKSWFLLPDTDRLLLPSWVPDLRHIQYVATLVSFLVSKQRFHAGGHSKPILSLSEDGLVLRAQGRIIDTVKTLAPTWVDALQLDHPEVRSIKDLFELAPNSYKDAPFNNWLLACYDLAARNVACPQAELLLTFARTMVCNMNNRDGLAEPEMLDRFSHYMGSCLNKVATPDEEPSPYPNLLPICAAAGQATMGRIFCVTGHLRLGQVPIGSEPGDRICILVGGETPYVIRPTGQGRYRLIGEAYVDGVMHGEALEESKYQDEEIQIE
ncbi:heterokaryon incompatibility protein-domain-containing protein [Xylaria acuta]|nr:heterokaryon incompatibility protein-domain-containing protein [Xylaria acuta]